MMELHGQRFQLLWEQLEQIYDDIEDGKLDKTGKFYTAQKAVKDKYPKP